VKLVAIISSALGGRNDADNGERIAVSADIHCTSAPLKYKSQIEF